MKRSGIDHPKIGRLASLLEIPRYGAVGLLESLWHFTAKHAPAGDVGKWTDDEIAAVIGWPGGAAKLKESLLGARLLDVHPTARLLVHDWPDHCEDSVHVMLARRIAFFADGTKPNLTRLSKQDRQEIEAKYHALNAHASVFDAHESTRRAHESTRRVHESTRPAKPGQARPSQAKPSPGRLGNTSPGAGVLANGRKPGAGTKARRPSVFWDITEEVLNDTDKLHAWWRTASGMRKPVIGATGLDWQHVLEAAEHARRVGENPAALFASTIAAHDWSKITAVDEERASERRRAFDRASTGLPATIKAPPADGSAEQEARRQAGLAALDPHRAIA